MKSYLAYADTIYEGIFQDAATRWFDSRSHLMQDLTCLRRDVNQRGLAFLTLTLPSLGKVFDKALSHGRLTFSDIPQGIRRKANNILLFRTLFDKVFDDLGCVRSDADVDAIFYLRQLLYCCKKMRLECDVSKTKEALNEFFAIEQQLPQSYPNTWDSESPTWEARVGHPLWGVQSEPLDQLSFDVGSCRDSTPLPWHEFRLLCRYALSSFGEVDWWTLRGRHGPGAVSETKSDWISKYEFPFWPRKLDLLFPYDWFGSGILDSEFWPIDKELPSRLIVVPKTQKGPRVICSEPLSHQWMQQSILSWIESGISRSVLGRSINFRDQELSRRDALAASLTGERCTIDLSSASDRISTRLVEYVFQGFNILDGLHATRTRMLSQDLTPDHPKWTILRKFSTMGSAVTFPVQSIIFTLLTVWALRLAEGKHGYDGLEDDFSRVRVYGDDIIAPSTAFETIKLVLHECGLKVNESKTFNEGFFRESCGCDAYKGHDVTPAYILQPYDDSPSMIATTVQVSNNFHIRGLWRTAEKEVSQIPEKEYKLLYVASVVDGTFGLTSFSGSSSLHLKKRWDENLQCWYSTALLIDSKSTKVQGGGLSGLTQYFTEVPRPDVNWSSGQVRRARSRKKRARVYLN